MITIYKNENSQLKKQKEIEAGTWINVDHFSSEELDEIHKSTNIELNLLKKLMDTHETARVEQREDTVLIVLKVPIKKYNGYRTVPLGIIVAPNHIVTICNEGNQVFKQPLEDSSLNPLEKTNFTIQIFYYVATLYLSHLEEVQNDLQNQEKSLYHATNNTALKGLMKIEKSLVYFMQSLSSNEMVLERIASGNVLPLYKGDERLLEDAMIENRQAIAMANLYQELLSSLTGSYGTIISNNLNQIMKFLAGITIVISIPTMVSSFIGMNVPLGKIGEDPMAFLYLCIFSLIISLIVAFYLKRKNML